MEAKEALQIFSHVARFHEARTKTTEQNGQSSRVKQSTSPRVARILGTLQPHMETRSAALVLERTESFW